MPNREHVKVDRKIYGLLVSHLLNNSPPNGAIAAPHGAAGAWLHWATERWSHGECFNRVIKIGVRWDLPASFEAALENEFYEGVPLMAA